MGKSTRLNPSGKSPISNKKRRMNNVVEEEEGKETEPVPINVELYQSSIPLKINKSISNSKVDSKYITIEVEEFQKLKDLVIQLEKRIEELEKDKLIKSTQEIETVVNNNNSLQLDLTPIQSQPLFNNSSNTSMNHLSNHSLPSPYPTHFQPSFPIENNQQFLNPHQNSIYSTTTIPNNFETPFTTHLSITNTNNLAINNSQQPQHYNLLPTPISPQYETQIQLERTQFETSSLYPHQYSTTPTSFILSNDFQQLQPAIILNPSPIMNYDNQLNYYIPPPLPPPPPSLSLSSTATFNSNSISQQDEIVPYSSNSRIYSGEDNDEVVMLEKESKEIKWEGILKASNKLNEVVHLEED